MRGRVLAWLLSYVLLLAAFAPVVAQEKPVAAQEKKDAPRDGATQVVPYTLAAVGLIIVMILVCMPVRRE